MSIFAKAAQKLRNHDLHENLHYFHWFCCGVVRFVTDGVTLRCYNMGAMNGGAAPHPRKGPFRRCTRAQGISRKGHGQTPAFPPGGRGHRKGVRPTSDASQAGKSADRPRAEGRARPAAVRRIRPRGGKGPAPPARTVPHHPGSAARGEQTSGS